MDTKDVMQEQVVPQLYSAKDHHTLSKDAEVDYQEGKIRVVKIDENQSVIVMQPEGITYEKAQGILLGISGYTMPPTSILGDNFTIPLMEKLKETDSIAVFFAPYGRGSENPITNQGRWTAGKIRRYTAMEAKKILEHFNGQENGALAYCPGALDHSQLILRSNKGKLGFNLDFIKKIPDTVKPIIKAILTGKGIEFDETKGKRMFFDEQDLKGAEEVLKRLFPDSALYFLQALTVGAGKRIRKDSLQGERVGLMGAEEDTIITDGCMEATHKALIRSGANLRRHDVRGGHFAPFLNEPDIREVSRVQLKHEWLLRHVIE